MALNLDVPDPYLVEPGDDARAYAVLSRFLNKVEREPRDWIGYDVETSAKKLPFKVGSEKILDWMSDRVTFWSLSARFDGKPERYCLEQGHLQMFIPLLENRYARFATWNGKYDAHTSYNSDVFVWNSQYCDIQVCAQMVNENLQMGGMGLKNAAKRGYTSELNRVLSQGGFQVADWPKWLAKGTFQELPEHTRKALELGWFDDSVFHHKNIPMSPFKSIFGDKDIYGNKAVEYETSLYNLPIERVSNYASLDSYATLMLAEHLQIVLAAHDSSQYSGYLNLWDYYWDFERLVTQVLWRMERRGIPVDNESLQSKLEPLEHEMAEVQGRIVHAAQRPLNIDSPQQLQEFLFGNGRYDLGLKPKKRTATGAPGTDEEVLAAIAADGVEVARDILRFRKLRKIKSTYVDGLIKLSGYFEDGRIHPEVKQFGARTGRTSTKGPNSQNLPTPDNDDPTSGGFGIRQTFIAPKGYVLLVADYGQLEMRIMAHFSQDRAMLDAIRAGMDMHCVTVERMWGVPYDEVKAAKKFKDKFGELVIQGYTFQDALKVLGVTAEFADKQFDIAKKRSQAKTVGFGIFYGAGPSNIALQLDCTKDEAQELLDAYFKAYPGVKSFIRRTHLKCQNTEYVTTLIGRRRNLPEINAVAWVTKGHAEREAVNSIIQGTAADIVKAAMIRCEFDPDLQEAGVQLINQIHDELVFLCPEEVADWALTVIKDYMEHPFAANDDPLDVATPVDARKVANWAQAK